jgi:hypothetical protein
MLHTPSIYRVYAKQQTKDASYFPALKKVHVHICSFNRKAGADSMEQVRRPLRQAFEKVELKITFDSEWE